MALDIIISYKDGKKAIKEFDEGLHIELKQLLKNGINLPCFNIIQDFYKADACFNEKTLSKFILELESAKGKVKSENVLLKLIALLSHGAVNEIRITGD